jgi:hypothetical protein
VFVERTEHLAIIKQAQQETELARQEAKIAKQALQQALQDAALKQALQEVALKIASLEGEKAAQSRQIQ